MIIEVKDFWHRSVLLDASSIRYVNHDTMAVRGVDDTPVLIVGFDNREMRFFPKDMPQATKQIFEAMKGDLQDYGFQNVEDISFHDTPRVEMTSKVEMANYVLENEDKCPDKYKVLATSIARLVSNGAIISNKQYDSLKKTYDSMQK